MSQSDNTELSPEEQGRKDFDAVIAERSGNPEPKKDEAKENESPPDADQAVNSKSEKEPEPAKEADDEVSYLKKINDELAARLRKQESTIGNLTRDFAAFKDQASKKPEPTKQEIPASDPVPKAPPQIERLKTDYPEIAEGIEAMLASQHTKGLSEDQVAQMLQQGISDYQASTDQRLNQNEQLVAQRVTQQVIELRHPGWLDTVKTPDFTVWFNDQNAETRSLAQSDRAKDAIDLLDAYAKRSTPKPSGRNKDRLRESATPQTRTTAQVTTDKPESEMSDRELFDLEVARRKQRKQMAA